MEDDKVRDNITDVKEQKYSETDAIEEFQTLIEDAHLGYQSLDENGYFLSVNKAWLDITGYEKHEVIGKCFCDFLSSDSKKLFNDRFAIFKLEGHTSVICSLVTKNKETLAVNFTGIISYFPDGTFKKTHCILENLTEKIRFQEEKKIVQEKLWYQQKLEAISTLAGGVAHEINNPLNGILNYGQVILDSLPADSPINGYVEEIMSEANRIAVIVKSLLDYSRQSDNYHSLARIEDIISKTVSLISGIFKHDDIVMEMDIAENMCHIRCRSQQIQQVLMNLFTNARESLNAKYTNYNENKKIKLKCNEIEKDGKKFICISVEDTGRGIPASYMDNLFNPFFSTKPRENSAGLGLSICQGIIRTHGGDIEADSIEGEYARFTFYLPCDCEKE